MDFEWPTTHIPTIKSHKINSSNSRTWYSIYVDSANSGLKGEKSTVGVADFQSYRSGSIPYFLHNV